MRWRLGVCHDLKGMMSLSPMSFLLYVEQMKFAFGRYWGRVYCDDMKIGSSFSFCDNVFQICEEQFVESLYFNMDLLPRDIELVEVRRVLVEEMCELLGDSVLSDVDVLFLEYRFMKLSVGRGSVSVRGDLLKRVSRLSRETIARVYPRAREAIVFDKEAFGLVKRLNGELWVSECERIHAVEILLLDLFTELREWRMRVRRECVLRKLGFSNDGTYNFSCLKELSYDEYDPIV
jgi:hypothetical protein